MEKPAHSEHAKKHCRLLKIAFILLAPCFFCIIQPLTAQKNAKQTHQYEPILTVPTTICTAGETIVFIVQVPYVEPADVRYKTPSVPENVRFTSAKKSQSSSGTSRFTNIELGFTFLEAGTILLPPLEIIAAGVKHLVVFPEMTVHPELSRMTPSAFWSLQLKTNTQIHAGTAIPVILVVKNVLEIINFSCNPEETALFESKTPVLSVFDTKDIFLSNQNGIPAAQFLWTPLLSGEIALPSAKLIVRSLDGSEQVIFTENLTHTFLPAAVKPQAGKKTTPELTRAFLPQKKQAAPSTQPKIAGKETAEKIAALRKQERESFFPFAIASQRIAAEQESGIQSGKREPPAAWLIPLYGAALLCAIAAIILTAAKKRFCLNATTAALLLTVLAVSLHLYSSQRYAVTQSATVKIVPEQSASTAASLADGTRVRVLSTADSWLYIRYGDGRTGWVTAANVIFINGGRS